MNRLSSVLFWSVITAAFIGPGTVAAAAAAGAGHGYSLLWALVFSTIACLSLQEASTRITVISGLNLGQALRAQYSKGLMALAVLLLVLGAIVLGCAAYEVGNILGGVAGAVLGTGFSPQVLTISSGIIVALLLWFGAPRTIARLLSVFVAVMGVTFLVMAWQLGPAPLEVLRGALVPVIPQGSEVLVLGLVGTTVVPYNIFLGSSLARGQTLTNMRFGLVIAICFGGLVSMGIVIVGTAVQGPFSFETLAELLVRRLGAGAQGLFGIGLFAAGLSSAITAPLAAALTARSLFSTAEGEADPRWHSGSWRFRSVWGVVVMTGVAFGMAGIKPIPAIVLAQALNGLLLPLVAVFLLVLVNDRRLLGQDGINGAAANLVMVIVVVATVVLGLTGVVKAVTTALGLPQPGQVSLVVSAGLLVLLCAYPIGCAVRRRRINRPHQTNCPR